MVVSKTSNHFLFTVYVFIAIVLVAVVAYVVYIQCRPSVETFTDKDVHTNTIYVAADDRLNRGLDSSISNDWYTQEGVGNKQRIDEAHIRLMESIHNNRNAVVKYGERHADEKGNLYLNSLDSETGQYKNKIQDAAIAELRLPMFGLQCMWSNTESHSGSSDTSSIDCTLCITLFILYSVGTKNRMKSESFDVELSVDKTYKSFIPINGDIINRKIAHTAKVVRVCIERKDDDDKSILGVEKVCVVKYIPAEYKGNLSEDDPNMVTYTAYAGKNNVNQDLEKKMRIGTRLSMGVMKCDPVCLVSQEYTPTDVSHVPQFGTTPSMVADVSYGQQEPVYGNSGTHCFKVYVSFAFPDNNKNQVSLYFGNIQTSQQAYFREYCANDNQNIHLLTEAYQNTNTNGPQLLAQNVAKATLFNVQPNVVYEVAIALTEQLSTDNNGEFSFNVVASDKDVIVQSISYVPLNGHKQSEPKLLVAPNAPITTDDKGYITIESTTKSMIRSNQANACADYIVDADATILRFNNNPRSTNADAPPQLSECGIFSVNDGFVFSGSLLTPLHNGTAHANHLCTLSLQFEKKRLVIKLTQDSVYLYDASSLMNKPIKTVPHNLVANDVSWYIYVYKDTVGVCINDTVSFSNHDKLKLMYNKSSTNLANSYSVLTNVKLTVDPAITIESRLITALAIKPTVATMKRSRSDTVNLLCTKASLLYKNILSSTNSADNALVTRDLVHPQSTLQNDSGFSMQFEITNTSIIQSIQKLPDGFYQTSQTNSNREEAVLFQTSTVKIVLEKQRSNYPSPLLYDISVYFTSESGQCVNTPRVIGSHKMLEPTSQTDQSHIMIKYSNYKKTERVCIVRYNKDHQEGRLLSSIEHTLASNIKPKHNTISFHQYAIVNLVCGARVLSTNCNPYNNSRMCDCAGRVNGNPHEGIKNNVSVPTAFETLGSQAENTVITTPYDVSAFTSVENCMKYALDQFGSNGAFSTYTDTTGQSHCAIANIQDTAITRSTDDNSNSHTYVGTVDEGMRLMLAFVK